MERTQKPKTKNDARRERSEVKLQRRYGEIGISAVKAAAVQYRAKESVNSEGEKHDQKTKK